MNVPDEWAGFIQVFLTTGRMPYMPGQNVYSSMRETMTMMNWCIWHYRFGQNTNGRFIRSKVHVMVFTNNPRKQTWNPIDISVPSDRASKYNDPRTTGKKDGMPDGMRVPLDVWHGPYFGRVQGTNIERRKHHKNQIPEAYMGRVIAAYTNPGDIVMDPFTGSGTTGTVARHMGRKYIGSELSARNAKSAFERMKMGPVRIGKDGRVIDRSC